MRARLGTDDLVGVKGACALPELFYIVLEVAMSVAGSIKIKKSHKQIKPTMECAGMIAYKIMALKWLILINNGLEADYMNYLSTAMHWPIH